MINQKIGGYIVFLISCSWSFSVPSSCPAQGTGHVVLDGSLGTSGALTGPNFTIADTMGRTMGSNLFHSFSQFDLVNHETATFTGPMNIRNIIARVTGGAASSIDGTIDSSMMPNANFFLINPFGVLFGPHASLKVAGSFTATSASYVELADGGRFDAVNPANDVLTTAPVSAFGFSGDTPGSLTVQQSSISVGVGQSFSLIGGDITVDGATFQAPSGRINLASIKSAGVLVLDVTDPNAALQTGGFTQLGEINLQNGAIVDTSGDGGGQIVIRGGTLLVKDSTISSVTTGGSADGQGIDIQVSGDVTVDGGAINSDAFVGSSGNAGAITITSGRDFSILNMGDVESVMFGSGAHAGDITIQANALTLSRGSMLAAGTQNTGSGGTVDIHAQNVNVNDLSKIEADTSGDGVGGDITVHADSIVLDGLLQNGNAAGFGEVGIFAGNLTAGGGNSSGGNITIQTGSLDIRNGAGISTGTVGSQTIAGQIQINTGALTLDNKADITSLSVADAGGVTIVATRSIHMNDSSAISVTSAAGNGGDIDITAGGDIRIVDSRITAQAAQNGGDITLHSPSLVYLLNGQLLTLASGNNGGNVTIDPEFVILDNSKINSSGGNNGGNIMIAAGYVLASPNLRQSLNATGQKGVNGTVQIDASTVDLSGVIHGLQATLLDAESQLRPYCGVKLAGGISSFLVVGRGGLALEPAETSPSFGLPSVR